MKEFTFTTQEATLTTAIQSLTLHPTFSIIDIQDPRETFRIWISSYQEIRNDLLIRLSQKQIKEFLLAEMEILLLLQCDDIQKLSNNDFPLDQATQKQLLQKIEQISSLLEKTTPTQHNPANLLLKGLDYTVFNKQRHKLHESLCSYRKEVQQRISQLLQAENHDYVQLTSAKILSKKISFVIKELFENTEKEEARKGIIFTALLHKAGISIDAQKILCNILGIAHTINPPDIDEDQLNLGIAWLNKSYRKDDVKSLIIFLGILLYEKNGGIMDIGLHNTSVEEELSNRISLDDIQKLTLDEDDKHRIEHHLIDVQQKFNSSNTQIQVCLLALLVEAFKLGDQELLQKITQLIQETTTGISQSDIFLDKNAIRIFHTIEDVPPEEEQKPTFGQTVKEMIKMYTHFLTHFTAKNLNACYSEVYKEIITKQVDTHDRQDIESKIATYFPKDRLREMIMDTCKIIHTQSFMGVTIVNDTSGLTIKSPPHDTTKKTVFLGEKVQSKFSKNLQLAGRMGDLLLNSYFLLLGRYEFQIHHIGAISSKVFTHLYKLGETTERNGNDFQISSVLSPVLLTSIFEEVPTINGENISLLPSQEAPDKSWFKKWLTQQHTIKQIDIEKLYQRCIEEVFCILRERILVKGSKNIAVKLEDEQDKVKKDSTKICQMIGARLEQKYPDIHLFYLSQIQAGYKKTALQRTKINAIIACIEYIERIFLEGTKLTPGMIRRYNIQEIKKKITRNITGDPKRMR